MGLVRLSGGVAVLVLCFSDDRGVEDSLLL